MNLIWAKHLDVPTVMVETPSLSRRVYELRLSGWTAATVPMRPDQANHWQDHRVGGAPEPESVQRELHHLWTEAGQ